MLPHRAAFAHSPAHAPSPAMGRPILDSIARLRRAAPRGGRLVAMAALLGAPLAQAQLPTSPWNLPGNARGPTVAPPIFPASPAPPTTPSFGAVGPVLAPAQSSPASGSSAASGPAWTPPQPPASVAPPPSASASAAPSAPPLAARSLQTVPWRNPVFFIPYAANPLDADRVAKVMLHVSRDGQPWQLLEEARPEVRGFAYHAPAEGTYQFALQFADRSGRVWPAGPPQAQLAVQIDSTPPQVTLTGRRDSATDIAIRYELRDPLLDRSTCRLEIREGAAEDWRPLELPLPEVDQPNRCLGGSRAGGNSPGQQIELRMTVRDRAGNEGVATAQVGGGGPLFAASDPRALLAAAGSAAAAPPAAAPYDDPFADASRNRPAARGGLPAIDWPESNATATAAATAASPSVVGPESFAPPQPPATPYLAQAPPAPGNAGGPAPANAGGPAPGDRPPLPPGPFSQVSSSRWSGEAPPLLGSQAPGAANSAAIPVGETPSDAWVSRTPRPGGVSGAEGIRHVNSRTFEVHYDLQSVGPWGVSKVELWGTQDDGQSWLSYGLDADHRSPFQVTVAEPGTYGFVIVVDAAGGIGAPAPRAGDRPDLRVAVDVTPPQCQLVPAERGSGEYADHLLIRWQATDDNLEPRPIVLAYSSSAAGPWSTIAAGLENTGVYPWKLERHLPERFYLRLEVRDVAGNQSADQTDGPVLLDRPQPVGRLRDVRPVGP